ncbi:hypothetical protein [uncultured Sulfitobacter sp.]|uniref:hypothetical protein n=1 Tax=uncultured Sulfitobacter sp. TaxID=191468 RepID=UPI00261154A9|nr:hypothetical protein [uncultured Sulfitobacter sp.]
MGTPSVHPAYTGAVPTGIAASLKTVVAFRDQGHDGSRYRGAMRITMRRAKAGLPRSAIDR